MGQDVGADVGGGAGIFRPKNPETKNDVPSRRWPGAVPPRDAGSDHCGR